MSAATERYSVGDQVKRRASGPAVGDCGVVIRVINKGDSWTAQRLRVRWNSNGFEGLVDSRQVKLLTRSTDRR
jgi:hypothetical protein